MYRILVFDLNYSNSYKNLVIQFWYSLISHKPCIGTPSLPIPTTLLQDKSFKVPTKVPEPPKTCTQCSTPPWLLGLPLPQLYKVSLLGSNLVPFRSLKFPSLPMSSAPIHRCRPEFSTSSRIWLWVNFRQLWDVLDKITWDSYTFK